MKISYFTHKQPPDTEKFHVPTLCVLSQESNDLKIASLWHEMSLKKFNMLPESKQTNNRQTYFRFSVGSEDVVGARNVKFEFS